MTSKQSFDRVRPRTVAGEPGINMIDGEIRVPDREGKRALFSEAPEPPTFGAIALTCTRCDSRAVVSWTRALRLAFPSIPAVVPGTGVRVWMKCPTCRQRAWVDLSLRC